MENNNKTKITELIEEYNEMVKQYGLAIPSYRTIDTNTDNVTVQNICFKSGFNVPTNILR